MPIVPESRWREEYPSPVADMSHLMHKKSGFLVRSYFNEDQFGQIIVRPGMVLALNSAGKYTPYSATAAYGVGSDTAAGILQDPQDATYDEPAITVIVHGKLTEAHCYVYGATSRGNIPAAVKTTLALIEWV